MINLLAIVLLRFAPLVLLLVFCLALARLVKEELTAPAYYLVVDREPGDVELPWREIKIFDEVVTVGRAGDNRVVLPDPFVSGRHCRLEQEQGELWLVDLGSTNGTFVNGQKVNGKVRLKPKDSVAIGGILFRVEKGGEHADRSPNPRGVSKAEERG